MLASASPRRLDLLAQIGVFPELCLSADIDESVNADEAPRATALRLARGKAASVASREMCAEMFVLGADTVVSVGQRQLGKTETVDEARRCLQLLSGRRHVVTTAVVLRAPGGREASRVVATAVAFSRLSGTHVEHLIAAGDWQGKAGGYAIQGHAASVARFVSGSYSGVGGLPLFETAQLLRGGGLLP